MKKFLALALVLIMVLAFAACGKDTGKIPSGGDGNNPDASMEQNTQEPGTNETETPADTNSPEISNDYGTVEGFLAIYGLTKADLEPEFFIEFDELAMAGSEKPGELNSIGYIKITVDKDATGSEQVDAWFKKLYAKLKTLSLDGKLHRNVLTMGTENDEEATLEALMENPLWATMPGGSCAYLYQSSTGEMRIMVSTRYDYETGVYSLSIAVL